MEEAGEHVRSSVERALREDTAWNDITTGLAVRDGTRGEALVRARGAGVISGHRVAGAVFRMLDDAIVYEAVVSDGGRVAADEIVARLQGSVRAILTGERTALNFLGHLSGIASLTARFVEQVAGAGVVILDTRKTTPGLRVLEKEAVRHGGGSNHRIDLGERILIKENHIAAAGGLGGLLERIGPERLRGAEIEVSCLAELELLRRMPPARIMLDNFTPEMVESAITELGRWDEPSPEIEVSGGITLETVNAFAVPGVDYISIGSITSSAPALDLSLVLGEVSGP